MQFSKQILSRSILTASAAVLCALTVPSAHALTIDTVTIGNPGNPHDPLTGGLYGGVSETYAIGKYEVTLTQYTEFLNAVAATDTYGLYGSMGTDLNIKGITRAGSSGTYTYAVFGDGQRPVTYVSIYDAMRYANWLGTGSTETGAYTLLGGTPTPSNGLTVTRNGGATVWIPSENEWYKAAYYDPTAGAGGGDNYWLYPMRSNATPTNNSPGAGANRGNFHDGDWAVTQADGYDPSQNYLTPVGAYTDSATYYGTFDQGGSVYEWNDTIRSSSRGVRGGSYSNLEDAMQASRPANGYAPTHEFSVIGFRVATVPEPTVSVSLMLAGGLLLSRRKRPSAL